jgi:Rnl2 family RNA ligase
VKTYPDTQYVAMEKIHGTNFSFISDGKDVKTCRRSAVLQSGEGFHSHQIFLETYRDKILKLFQLLLENGFKVSKIQLYGELYGSYYPGCKTTNSKVQSGIYYSNKLEFAAYDLKIDSGFVDWIDFESFMKQCEIPVVPVLAIGTFEEIFGLNPEFESVVYQMHGMKKIDFNFAEGFVAKPLTEILNEKGERFIWKCKNRKFSEILKSGKKNTMKANASSFEEIELAITLQTYVNMNRYNNVRTKALNDESVDTIIDMLIEDAWKDFFDDHKETLQTDSATGKKLMDILRRLANKFVRPIYKK